MLRNRPTTKTESSRYLPKRRTRKEANVELPPPHPLDATEPAVLREGLSKASGPREYRTTQFGKIFLGDSLELLRGRVADTSVDLIMTSPPFGLVRKKDYGNVDAHEYVNWWAWN